MRVHDKLTLFAMAADPQNAVLFKTKTGHSHEGEWWYCAICVRRIDWATAALFNVYNIEVAQPHPTQLCSHCKAALRNGNHASA